MKTKPQKKRNLIILIILISIVGLIIRFNYIEFESEDYKVFLSNWFSELKENGRYFCA